MFSRTMLTSVSWYVLLIFCFFSRSALATTGHFSLDPQLSHAKAVTQPSEFSVSQEGSAIYTLPISVPAGTAGMQPTLALTYNSQSGNGVLGMGWTLGGLSMIARCGRTLVDDGVKRAVLMTTDDHLCLDGERLVQVSSASGYIEYRKKMDSSVRIRGYGTAGNKPEYFVVWTASGQRFRFGTNVNSRITLPGTTEVITWGLAQVVDAAGNYMNISYTKNDANGDFRPNRINYTGNSAAGLSPYASVRFTYENRTDQFSVMTAGKTQKVLQRMTGIKTFVGETLAREYRLGYQYSTGSQVSLLSSITECAANNHCLEPNTFNWQQAQGSLSYGSPSTINIGSHSSARFADINGDGLVDIVTTRLISSSNTVQKLRLYLHLNNGNGGFSSPVSVGDIEQKCIRFTSSHNVICNDFDFVLGDFNGDGKADLAYYATTETYDAAGRFSYLSNLYYRFSNGAGFGSVQNGGELPVRTCFPLGFLMRCDPIILMSADINGDGKDDIVYALTQTYYTSPVIVFQKLATGSGFGANTEVVTFNRKCIEIPNDTIPARCDKFSINVGDVNGDGLADLVTSKPDTNAFQVSVYLGTGSNFSAPTNYTSPRVKNILLGDINDDGLADMVSHEIPVNATPIYMQLSTGNNFSLVAQLTTLNHPKLNYPINHSLGLGDMNGDGYADFITVGEAGFLQSARVRLAQLPTNDLLTGITDNLGRTTTVTYSRLSNSSVYIPGAASTYPIRTLRSSYAMDVVSRVTTPNGLGGTVYTDYQYTGGKMHLTGRGFLGFASVTATESATGNKAITHYSQQYPYIGQVVRSERRITGNVLVEEIENTFAHKSLHSNKVLLPYLKETSQLLYEVNGLPVKGVVTSYEVDDFGNHTQVQVTVAGQDPLSTNGATEQFMTHTTHTYSNNTANWFLGRLTRVSNTQSHSKGGSATRVSSFEYNAQGLLSKEIIEPDLPALRQTTTYAYDAFGNITTSTVSGTGITPHTTSTQWGGRVITNFGHVNDNGRFPVAETNAQGHTEIRAFESAWGSMTRLQDPNGLTTDWTYDAFGRQLSETQPDGTVITTSRGWCSATTCPANGFMKTIVSQSGSVPSVIITDSLGREIRSATQGRNGQAIYSDTQYNNKGQIIKQSLPYFAGATPLWSQLTYDALGRLTRELSPDGSDTITGYGVLTTTIRNARNQLNERVTNVRGDIVWVHDAEMNQTLYRYDVFGNLIETEDDAGNKIINSYDIRGRKIAMNDPDMGLWTYQYNVLGDLVSQTDAKAQTVTMSYDQLGRMVSRTETEGTSTWLYDSATHGIGKLAEVSGAAGDVRSYQYDILGRPVSVTQQIGSQSYTLSTTYDAFSRVSQLTYPPSSHYPSGLKVSYHYTQTATDGSEGYLKTVTNAISNAVYWQAQSQNAAGQLTEITLGNGITTRYEYQATTNLIQSIKSATTANANDIQNLRFEFDNIGNLTKRLDYNQMLGMTALQESFGYDSLNRMTSSTVSQQTAKTYQYDSLGNLTFKTDVGSYSYGSNAGPHAVTQVSLNGVVTAYHYDANGNMTSGAGRTIQYSSFNKPVNISQGTTTVNFSYGADRARLVRTDSSGRVRHYIDELFEQETHLGVTSHTHYIKAMGATVVIAKSTSAGQNTLNYLHLDHLGSINTVTDHQGLVVESLSYDPHGKRRHSDWTDITGPITAGSTTDRGFTGHEHLDEVGLIHMNGRVYDPVLGRFISADPHIQAPYNGQSLNRYSYVLNNPLSYTDPSGFFFKKIFKSIFKAIGSVFKAIRSILDSQVLRTIAAVAIVASGGSGFVLYAKGFAAGYIGSGGDLRAGIVGAVAAGAFHGIGEYYSRYGSALKPAQSATKTLAHGLLGGTASLLNGGKFGQGFLSAGFNQQVGGFSERYTNSVARITSSAASGGVSSVLGGGKFANGATTGTYMQTFSEAAAYYESYRVYRRLTFLRELANEQTTWIFTRR